ncbi:ABC transporter substrate-binding protein [Ktedonosporobacter rubrisoli]|uniref:ABC transporter substrate-binding protein n=1 Tax=Ktedonosporobacter rubrisoli TaxID=2509675 RepID=A0A4P6JSY8_KTERU|nr:ABC transporter substrate-binding protein [Ktedonosporobacter rubrisoli]QBD78679.1 ABC transporter substrate-binding protein [Ktedonosporobacter rubrisoli]
MIFEQRELLDETIVKIRSGRIKRRTFLERALTAGLSSAAALSLLEACGGTSNSTAGNGNTTMIVWQSQHDPSDNFKQYAENFNKQNNGIHVVYKNGPADTGQLLTIFTNMLRARSHAIDVLSMDIIWPPEFGANGWTVPISESQLPQSERQKFLPGPLQGCTYNGKLWAVPFTTEPGLLYYRKDLLPTPPNSWDELAAMAKSVSPAKIKLGYVWQGAQYEGLVCNFVEVLYGYGGSVLDPNDPKKVTINSPQAVQALTEMVSWLDTISPKAVTTYKEDDGRLIWQNGNAAFMRNWPNAYALGNDPKNSQIVGKFDVHAMPYGGSSSTGHSCIGGWQLGINAFSPSPDACWKFIQYLSSEQVQKDNVINTSHFSPLQSIPDDPEVQAKMPFVTKVKASLQNARSRPASPAYPDITDALQLHIHQALIKASKPADALAALQSSLEAIVAK